MKKTYSNNDNHPVTMFSFVRAITYGLSMQKKIKFFVLLFFGSMCVTAGLTNAQTGDAGQPGEFLRYGVGARALGMGHAFTGLADDASAVYWNPAGLMSVERKQFASMYTNLFLDSRYTYMAVALPRPFAFQAPQSFAQRVRNFVVGQHSSFGLAWVNLSMNDFDRRSTDNIPLGSFDVYDQAFMLSWAHETTSTWGILNYGINLKLVNQAFPGYMSPNSSSTQGWGFGADLGATFRPINLPLIKRLVSLRYLMPFQVGVAVQNILQPQIGIGSGEKDKYPMAFRWGASYALSLSQWRVNVLYDQEILSGRKMGHFLGAEALIPVPVSQIKPSLRVGFNSRTKSPSFGGGVQFDYIENAAIRLDFAYALKPHEALDNDFRLFLSVDFGRNYDAEYFTEQTNLSGSQREQMAFHLLTLTSFQENDELARASAWALADTYDRANRLYYLEFIKGLLLANALFDRLMEQIRESSDPDVIQKLQSQAREVEAEYNRVMREILKEQTKKQN